MPSLLCEQLCSRLKTAIEHARADAQMGRSVNTTDIEAIEQEFVSEIERLRSELAFYAEETNWQSPSKGFEAQYDPQPAPAIEDAGEKARTALSEAV